MRANGSVSFAVGYGAYELKSGYQQHMLLGIWAAAILHVAIVVAATPFLTVEKPQGESLIPMGRTVDPSTPIGWNPPPNLPRIDGVVPETPAIHPVGIPDPVPDELIEIDVVWATRDDLERLARPVDHGSAGGSDSDGRGSLPVGSVAGYSEWGIPDPSELVPVDEQPVPIDCVTPEYPELARLTETEGSVWIKAYGNAMGMVEKVLVAKSSGSNIGFDDAALEAAYKCRYKPAIQNGVPIGVWVTYVVEFVIR